MGWHSFSLTKNAERMSPTQIENSIRSKISPNGDIFVPAQIVGHRVVNLFQGYVFVKNVSADELKRIKSLSYIEDLITDEYTLVPDEDIKRMRDMLNAESSVNAHPGDIIKVIEGVAKGIEGEVYSVNAEYIYAFLDFGFISRPAKISKGDVEVCSSPPKIYVDAFNIFFRAFYSPEITTKDGSHIQAVYYFIQWLFRVRQIFKEHMIYVVWDGDDHYKYLSEVSGQDLSKELYTSFMRQLEITKTILRFLPVYQVSAAGVEADDIIAHLLSEVSDNSEIIIVSSNKDFFSLVTDIVSVAIPSGLYKKKPFRVVDKKLICSEYGISPDKLHIYRAFKGDPSEGMQGIPRLKSVSVQKLCVFSTIEEAICNADRLLSPGEAEKIRNNVDLILHNYGLIHFTPIEEVSYQRGVLSLRPLKDIFSELGFHGFLANFKSIAELWDMTGYIREGVSADKIDLEHFMSPSSCTNLLEEAVREVR